MIRTVSIEDFARGRAAEGIGKVSTIEEIAGTNPENQRRVWKRLKAERKARRRASGIEPPTQRDHDEAVGRRDAYVPPKVPKGWKRPPKAKRPTFTKAASFDEVLHKDASDRGLLGPRDPSRPVNPEYLGAAERANLTLAAAVRGVVSKSREPMSELAALEKVLRENPELGDFHDARMVVAAKAGGGQGSRRAPPRIADRSVPTGTLGPIETGTGLPPSADLDPKDVTPPSAYARLLALVRDYAAKHRVSEDVAWPTIADQHPELFALSKRTPHMHELTKRARAPS